MTTPNPYGPPAPGSVPGPPAYPSHPAPPAPPQGAGSGWPQPAWPAAPQQPAGRPAAPAGGPIAAPGAPASIGRRAAAYAIDAAIVGAAWLVLSVVANLLAQALGYVALLIVGAAAIVLLLGWFLVYTYMQGGHGSIGMRLMKLRLVRIETGQPLGFGGALLRNVIWGLATAIVVGFFSVFFDSSGRRQGWHDKVAHAFMRDAEDARTTSPAAAPAAPAAAPRPPLPGVPAASAAPVPPAPAAPAAPADLPPRPPLPPRGGVPSPGNLSSLFTTTPPPAPAGPSAAAPSEGLIAFVPGVTQDPPPAPAAAAAPAPVDELEDDTILVRRDEPDVEDTRLVARAPSAVLEWDDGTRHTVTGRAVFGRNPAGDEGVETVAVRDETLSLSKTHFELDVTGEGVFVVDRHSTNGVTVVRGGERIPATPGERVALEAEDALEIGDRIATLKAAG
ncbi:FHA domain-containing protein [Microbacterium sp. MEC084]|uniref:RDD family protein n=1 Tax=Microbacterium sp. MEC084 TaxID=1963027 RepID=UPI001E48DBFE|nr:RDD family protein [Microbacterium sp. MEC084]MCD1267829.1 FHA domain-containing protein [Microbacterium sp. MEC084]